MNYDNELFGKQNQQERVKLLDDIFNTYGTLIGENFIKKVLMVYSCPSAMGWKNNGNSIGCTQQANVGNSNCLACWSKALARNHYLKDKATKGGAA